MKKKVFDFDLKELIFVLVLFIGFVFLIGVVFYALLILIPIVILYLFSIYFIPDREIRKIIWIVFVAILIYLFLRRIF